VTAQPATVEASRVGAQRLFRQVMGRFATGVTIVTTRIGSDVYGMTANAFMAGSLEPLLCIVSINRSAAMHARLLAARRYGVSFLSVEQQHFAAHFAGRRLEHSAPEFDTLGSTPTLKRALAAVAAEVVDTADCGDHTLFIGRITDLALGASERPLLYYGGHYGRLARFSQTAGNEPPEFW
jgi:flavin reductase (DIM6/NTAB) family NADH-FMN oxidoreductase RutF